MREDLVNLQGNLDIVNESVDNASELLTRFGHIMAEYHAQLRSALMPLLKESRPIVRKRAISCLGKGPSSLKHMLWDIKNKLHVVRSCTWVHSVGSGLTGCRFPAHTPRL